MKKRGAGHVEVILSFILFISAVGLIFFVFNPISFTRNTDSSSQSALREIEKNSRMEMIQYSLSLVKSEIGQNDNILVNLIGIPDNMSVSAVSHSGKILRARRDGNFISLEWSGEEFVYLRFSEFFENTLDERASFSGGYKIGSAEEDSFLYLEKLKEINTTYYTDYEGLRRRLGLPQNIDFGFSVVLDGEVWAYAVNKVSPGVNVYASQKKEQFIDKNGQIYFGSLGVAIW